MVHRYRTLRVPTGLRLTNSGRRKLQISCLAFGSQPILTSQAHSLNILFLQTVTQLLHVVPL
jgi:hypothetical protein